MKKYIILYSLLFTFQTVAQTSAENNFANYKDKRHGSAKVTDWQIRFIWWLRRKETPVTEIAKMLGLRIGNIEDVLYKRYRHMERVKLWT